MGDGEQQAWGPTAEEMAEALARRERAQRTDFRRSEALGLALLEELDLLLPDAA